MVSPRKSGTSESGSPRLAKFIAGSVRRRLSLSSKKSSNTGTASESSQNNTKQWPPRTRTGHQQEMNQNDGSREVIVSPKSSSSSSSHHQRQRQRHRSIEAEEVSPLGCPAQLHFDDSFNQENLSVLANSTRNSKLSQKLGGILPGTPTSGYRNLSENSPDPSPRARSLLSRKSSPSTLDRSERKSNETKHLPRSPSTIDSLDAIDQHKLHVPDLGQTHDACGTPKNEQGISELDINKSTEKRNNRKPKAQFDFLFFNKTENFFSGKTKRGREKSLPGAAEEPSSPLLALSLSDQIKAQNFASDRSETIVFCRESVESFDESQCESVSAENLEGVRFNNPNGERMMSSIRSTSERDGFMQIMRRDRSANELHSLCSCMTTIDDVRRARSLIVGMSREDASQRDYKGETPMHALSNNKALAVNLNGSADFETKNFLVLYRQPTFDQESLHQLQELISKFLLEGLLPSFPGVMMIEDNKGYIPFEEGILDWIATVQKVHDADSTENDYYSTYLSSYTNAVSGAVSSAWKSTSTTFLTAMSKMTENIHQKESTRDIERGDSGSLAQVSSKDELTGDKCMMSRFSNKTKLSPHARFCLQMLSIIVDKLEKFFDSSPSSFNRRNDICGGRKSGCTQELRGMYEPLDLAARVVERIASIPNLLQTILLTSEDSDMEYAFSTTIIRRVLINKSSVGPWLTAMLQSSQRLVSRRAIDYLQTVSKLCCDEEKSMNCTKSSTRKQACDNVIDEVSQLRDFVPSLLSLGENGIEEVATTKVVSDVLDKMISKPFVATVVLCDAIFLALMIVGFRFAVNGMITGGSLQTVLSWIYVANTGIFYFLIQEIGKVVSLLLISSHSRKYFLSFWNLIDVLAIVLALTSSVAMRWQFAIHQEGLEGANALRGLLAVSTGFLWLRVLSFLKSINIQLATFILAIITITKDILYFCVILLTLVISFSQMFFTLLAPSSCAKDVTSSQQQCSQTEYLLQFYIMMLGDFGNTEREAFSTGFSVFLLVLYSFLVTVIMLNVLIAIAGDSYEKCLLNSQRLFGRARVMLVAELVSFQSLLRKRDYQGGELEGGNKIEEGVYSHWWMSGSWSWTRKWSRGSILFFGLSMFVTFVWTIAELAGFARGDKYVSIVSSLSSVFINIALYVTVILFLGRNSVSTKRETVAKKEWSNSLQRIVLRVLGASQERKSETKRRRKRGQQEWHGRVQFIQREMDRIAEKQVELLNDQSNEFQTMVNQSESRLRAELKGIEQRFRETNQSIVSAMEELKALISLSGSSTPGHRVPEEVEVDFQQIKS